MCDQDTERDVQEYLKTQPMSRRHFGGIVSAVSLGLMLPPIANAQDVVESNVMIKTPDGEADCYWVHPAKGASAAVLVWPDIFGLRPAFYAMGKRLAQSGYAVLTINPFYRSMKAPKLGEDAKTADIQSMMPNARALNATTHVTDAKAFTAWLDQQPQVDKKKKMGTTGYCMGGPMVMRAAATAPDRIGGAAIFHGGNGLATKGEDSPHLLIPKMKAGFLVAVAQNDDMQDGTVKETLKAAFTAAKLKNEVEVYPAMHGWCPPGGGSYNQEQAEKAWGRMLELFKTNLA
ncbi:MAG TPA: dienelactone hydrolase family protein [Candidatus Acidoferrum sp.]|nr:dienelactone hydrolase family protein [Candidatus Acidoferrum sp.]